MLMMLADVQNKRTLKCELQISRKILLLGGKLFEVKWNDARLNNIIYDRTTRAYFNGRNEA